MAQLNFLLNRASSQSLCFLEKQLEFVNKSKVNIQILSNFIFAEEIDTLEKKYNLKDLFVFSTEKNYEKLYFIVSEEQDLHLLQKIKLSTSLVFIIINNETINLDRLSFIIEKKFSSSKIFYCIKVYDGKWVMSDSVKIDYYSVDDLDDKSLISEELRNSLIPILDEYEFSLPVTLSKLNFYYFLELMNSNYSKIYINTRNYLEGFLSTIDKIYEKKDIERYFPENYISRYYIDYLKECDGRSRFLRKLTSKYPQFGSELYCDAHSLYDPVNSVNLSHQGIGFTRSNYFSKILFKLLESIRSNSVSVDRKIAHYRREKVIVFVLARLFPMSISEGNNSHYNVLKLFSKLIRHYNISQNENYRIKVIFTSEKTFVTPFGVRDFPSREKIENNINSFLKDGVVENEDDVYVEHCFKKTKKDIYASVLSILDNLKALATIFLGGTYDSKVVRTMTFKEHPVCFIPTTSTIDNPYGRIDKHFDVIRAINPYHEGLIKDHQISSRKIVHFSKPMFDSLELTLTQWSWDSYLSNVKSSHIMLTPLVGGRIVNWFVSLTNDEVDAFFELFARHKELIWVPIGISKNKIASTFSSYPSFKKLLDNKRIIPMGFTNDLASIIENSDSIFIPTLGGATTVAAAVTLNVPSIVDFRSDSNTIVPAEGQFKSFTEGFFMISRVIEDRDFSEALVDESKRILSKRFDVGQISKFFIDFIHKAYINSKDEFSD